MERHHRAEHHLGRLPPAHRAGPPDRRDGPALQRPARLQRRGAQHPGGARQQHLPEPPARDVLRAGDGPRRGAPAGHAAPHHPQRARRRPRRPLPGRLLRRHLRPGHRRRLVRPDPAARRQLAGWQPGRRRHRRRPGPRHARRRRHGAAAHRAACLRRRGPHARHRDGPRLGLPARTRHRPFRDLPVRRGRPVHRRDPGGPRRAHRPDGAPHRRLLPPGPRPRWAAARPVRRVRRPRLPGRADRAGAGRDAGAVHRRPGRAARRGPRRRRGDPRRADRRGPRRRTRPGRPADRRGRGAGRRRRRGSAPAAPPRTGGARGPAVGSSSWCRPETRRRCPTPGA